MLRHSRSPTRSAVAVEPTMSVNSTVDSVRSGSTLPRAPATIPHDAAGGRPPGRSGPALPLVQARHRLPARRLARPRAGWHRGDLELLRFPGREPDPLAVVHDLQRAAVLQQVTGRAVVDLHPQPLP